MRVWKIWSERGIAITELESIPTIQATIGYRKWDVFTATPGHYDPDIVREFYAALSPPVFQDLGIVNVRNHRVKITRELINSYFQSPPAPKTHLTGGLIDHEFFTEVDGRLASSLRRDKSEVWIPGERDLEYSSIHHELVVWTLFIKSNIIPSNDQTHLSPDVVQCVFSIQQGLPIDIGHVVHDQILDVAMGSVGILPFPCMITHFCWAAGVKVFENNRSDIAPVCNIGRTDYNNFARNAGLDEIPSTNPTAIKRRHLGAEEDMSETPHIDPIAIPEPSQPFRDVPPWAQMICTRLDDIS